MHRLREPISSIAGDLANSVVEFGMLAGYLLAGMVVVVLVVLVLIAQPIARRVGMALRSLGNG